MSRRPRLSLALRRAAAVGAVLALGACGFAAVLLAAPDEPARAPARVSAATSAVRSVGTTTAAPAASVAATAAVGSPATQTSATGAPPATTDGPAAGPVERVRYRDTRSLGLPFRGRLRDATVLPAAGRDFVTMDPGRWTLPNRAGRRAGTPKLIRLLLRTLRAYRTAHPGAARVVVGDLSRTRGGPFLADPGELGQFGREPSAGGHGSHQNGLDVDVYYPRTDGAEFGPQRLSQVDRALAQDLVDRFVRAGAQFVFVGPRLDLDGPKRVVQPLRFHDDHLHVRVHPPR